MAIDKKTLSEADIRTKYITPAIEQSGWDKMGYSCAEYEYRVDNDKIQLQK